MIVGEAWFEASLGVKKAGEEAFEEDIGRRNGQGGEGKTEGGGRGG